MVKRTALLVLSLLVGCGTETSEVKEQRPTQFDWGVVKIESVGGVIVSEFLKDQVLRTFKLTHGAQNQADTIPYKAVTFVKVDDQQVSKNLDIDPFTNPVEAVRKTGSFIVIIEDDGAIIYYPVWGNPRNEPPALSEASGDSLEPQSVLFYKIETRVSYSSYGECCGAYVGALRNNTNQPATISVTVSHTATSSISGGFDQRQIKLAINWQSSASRTWTVSQTVPPYSVVRIYAFGTGRRYYGQQYRYPPTAPSCSATPLCTVTDWSAFVAQGVGYTLQ